MEYVDFVIENYIWFILGGVVILMTVIGYFAEKTEFGKTTNKKEKKEQAAPITQTESIPTEEVLLDDELESMPNEVEEEPMANLDAIEIAEPKVEEESDSVPVEEPKEESNDIHYEQLKKEEETDEIPEDLYSGLDGTPNTYKNNSNSSEIDMDLPNIDSLKDDMNDDDIWKF